MNDKITHLTAAEVAERLRVSIGTLANIRCKGGGPRFIHFGRRVLYPLVEVERFERELLQSSTSSAKNL